MSVNKMESGGEVWRLNLRCLKPELVREKFNDDSFETRTSSEQIQVEELVEMCFDQIKKFGINDSSLPILLRDRHVRFLKKGLKSLPQALECLDASRPWLCYWIIHALQLLDSPLMEEQKSSIIKFLVSCQHPDGGFGGGPYQHPHLAPTYAAVNALCSLHSTEAFEAIDRKKLLNFLFKMKRPNGSFSMHEGGEDDIRGVYCAVSVAVLTNIGHPNLIEGTAKWVASCQTYEGGFGGVPNMEAHGGYTFCGFASLVIMHKEELCNIPNLLRWLVNKQMRYEGGFQGRTNKLVDSCYSFWQAGAFPLICRFLHLTGCTTLDSSSWLFNHETLQEYLLICCQSVSGGLVDKPEKHRDYYHTCYALSGLSLAQHSVAGCLSRTSVVGSLANELVCTHPAYNITVDSAEEAMKHFSHLQIPEHETFQSNVNCKTDVQKES